ncbi:rhodanese-like domain-containing protein [Cytobacillus dafuensis]|uniref:Rhodanese-like domain-containing protein n=1 Tax=Cytobacillus dafuensis TaxID=1742359 RepID=A0A5B8Z1K4_CYTDA|nr:rhodanese-like domain-containing protein [Cytobacillus dafuensis]QED46657.1 rhodanese-like domain-containing protein [Cytobacillus dafuensis]
MKKKLFLLLALSLLLALTACSSKASYENIDNEAAKKLIEDNKVEVIDVRTLEEYAEGHIPESSLLPLQELETRISELNKEKSYLLVCRSGNRSGQAAQILIDNGFTNIYNLKTGMNEWPFDVVK